MVDAHAPRTGRLRLPQRLYVRIYVALLASLGVASLLFGATHVLYGGRPAAIARGHVGMLMLVAGIALIVAVASYPVVRRLTRRLERLQSSVLHWGAGDLSTRVAVEGSDEIAELAISFNQAATHVEALMNAQKTLLANASHELRSPLTRIRMAVELLQESAPPPVRAELARNIKELDQLIEEVLLASRLDARSNCERPFETVDFTALVAEESARVAADCSAQRTKLSGDPLLLRRMIRNLLENAQRHGGATPVRVVLTDEAHEVRLDVSDGGSGVPRDEREAIFAPFYRVRGASEADGGYGLGLSLVRQIVRRHDGDVFCIEGPAGGALFRVTLPRRAAAIR